MTKRETSKDLFLAALRGDAAAQRACTANGKPCGGRCIPKHWNCRLRGEGETPPTRGGTVQLSPEQRAKALAARRNRRVRRAAGVAAGVAGVAAAVGGAAYMGAKNPARTRRIANKLARGGASEALGVASAIGGPAAAGIAGVANLGVAGFQVGARLGAGVAQRRRAVQLYRSLAKRRLVLSRRVTQLEKGTPYYEGFVRRAQANLAAKEAVRAAARESGMRLGQGQRGYKPGQSPRSIAQTDKIRKQNLVSSTRGLREANKRLRQHETKLNEHLKQLEAAKKSLNSINWKVNKIRTGLNSASSPIRNTLTQSLSASRSSFRSGRRQVSGFIRNTGRRGPKPDARSWQERFGLDSAEERTDKKCGASGIAENKKCSKGSAVRTAAKAAAAAALVAGGAVAVRAAAKGKTRRRFRRNPLALSRYQREQLAKMKAKGTGKYGARSRRSFTSQELPYFTEADRIRPLYNKRLFKNDLEYRGEEFAGYNKPKRTPDHPKKSHAVLAKEGGTVKLIRFGQQGVKGSPKKEGESKSYAARRSAFKARHAANIKKGKMSAAYWANRAKW